jgi:hypothetical protein
MLMIARDREYEDIRDSLKGKKVIIWTCNTCARLCNGMGGDEAANNLASVLKRDGIEIKGVMSTSASCLKGKVRQKEDKEIIGDADTILSLTCDIGSQCASSVFGIKALNPFVTLGPGFIDEDRSLFVSSKEGNEKLSNEASKRGLKISPYV